MNGTQIGRLVTSQETLRRLALADEHFVENQAGLGFRPAWISALMALGRKGWP